MEQKSCLQAIRHRYESLTAAEKKIADYILQNAERVMLMSIGELSESAGAAKSAVVRCCKSLGFEGYSQMKIALAAEMSRNKQLNYAPYIYPEDSVDTILDKVFSANVKAVHDTAEQLDRAAVKSALERISAAGSIYLYGVGTSAGAVLDFQYRLMQLGFSAFAFTDDSTMRVSTINIREGDVAIGISYSGRAVATIETMELARAAGAWTVCITGYPDSPITRVCHDPISVHSDEIQYPVEAMSAKIAQYSLIYAMTVALSAQNYEDTVLRAKRTRDLLDAIRLDG